MKQVDDGAQHYGQSDMVMVIYSNCRGCWCPPCYDVSPPMKTWLFGSTSFFFFFGNVRPFAYLKFGWRQSYRNQHMMERKETSNHFAFWRLGHNLLLIDLYFSPFNAGIKIPPRNGAWRDFSLGILLLEPCISLLHASKTNKSPIIHQCVHYVTRHKTPMNNILSTAPQLSIVQKALGTLPEDGNVMPEHVESTIHD
jgi:hypothetical protein